MNRKFFIILGCCVGLGLYSASAGGEEFQINNLTGSVESGKYRPLTFWATISLGTSYYTNPQRAQNINVAYAYEGPEFSDDLRNKTIWDLAKSGKISFGIVGEKAKSITVIDFATLKQRFSLHEPADLPKVLARSDVKIVAADKTLLGERAKSTVVKTDEPQKAK